MSVQAAGKGHSHFQTFVFNLYFRVLTALQQQAGTLLKLPYVVMDNQHKHGESDSRESHGLQVAENVLKNGCVRNAKGQWKVAQIFPCFIYLEVILLLQLVC